MDTGGPRKYNVFLSYSRKDEVFVKRLHADLTERGVTSFLDQRDIHPGELFEEKIFSDIANSRAYGLVVTGNSLNSNWVQREYAYAKELFERKQIRLIPLLYERNLPDHELASHNGLPFWDSDKYDENLSRLIFPGITGKEIIAVLVNPEGGQHWGYALGRELERRYGVAIDAPGDIDRGGFALDMYLNEIQSDTFPWIKEKAESLKRSRMVVVIDVSCGWPENPRPRNTVEECLEFVFKYRERTRGKLNEIIFLLFHRSDALNEFDERITKAFGSDNRARLNHYFQLHTDLDAAKTKAQLDVVWSKIQRELMRVEQ